MFHCQKGDVFRYKGEIAECIFVKKATLTIKVGNETFYENVDSVEFQKSISTVSSPKYIPDRYLSIADILCVVCEYFNLSTFFVTGMSRKKEYNTPRFIYIHLCTKFTRDSLKNIGISLSNRDHTTVMHARDTVKDLLDAHDVIADDVYILEQKIQELMNNIEQPVLLKNVS